MPASAAGGLINMSYQPNETVHNTQWITDTSPDSAGLYRDHSQIATSCGRSSPDARRCPRG
jgi:hypothetical protein